MKSRANIKSHPIHPILIPFPIAFFTATFVLDCITALYSDSAFPFTRYFHMAGIIAAIAAAIPGLIDFLYTVPPASSARKRASKHALLNVLMLVLFIISYFMRLREIQQYLLILETPGFLMMLVAGWHGGTLVHRNLIGVDMRYANAGKWKEQTIEQKDGFIELLKTDELQPNQMKLFHLNGKRIVLAKTEVSFVAFDDRCSHRGGSLAGGMMICETVQCPWHGSQFELEGGEVMAGPAKEKIKTYPLVIQNQTVFIEISKIG